LNGIGRGARYDGTFGNEPRIGSCVNNTEVGSFTPQYKEFLRKYFEIQIDVYGI
jgi:glucan 1,3-beta-glucosidase